jgi:sarcosine oxidase subunit gamma
MAEALRRSPLQHRTGDLAGLATVTHGAIAASEVAPLSQIDLRVDAELAARRALPVPVPVEPNTVAEASPGRADVLWLGPDEWLVVSPAEMGPSIAGELRAALAGTHHSIVDVSANRAVVDLVGSGSLDLLSQGCPLDLHPRRWRPGMCAGTLIGRAQAVLQQRKSSTRLFVRPSFGDYLVDWLIEAARAYEIG